MKPTSLVSRRRVLAGAAALALLGGTAVPALAATSVKEKLTNFKITGASKAEHGTVTFRVMNPSSAPHELVVIRTKTKAAKLKLKGGRAVETGSVGEVEVAPGKSGTLKVKLKKGHYALICNVGSHYMLGMSKDFTVK